MNASSSSLSRTPVHRVALLTQLRVGDPPQETVVPSGSSPERRKKKLLFFLSTSLCLLLVSTSTLLMRLPLPDSSLTSESSFFSLPTWTDDQWLYRNPRGIQCLTGTLQASQNNSICVYIVCVCVYTLYSLCILLVLFL